MIIKNALRLAGLMMAAAAGAVLVGGPATAGAPEEAAPAAVLAWFAGDAPRTAGDVLANKAVTARGAGDTSRAAGSGYRAGPPHRLHTWGAGVLADDSANVTAATDEWVAALFLDERVIGTIAAVDRAGAVRFTYLDDDAAAGAALTAPGQGKIVKDPQLGGLAAVAADGSATGLSAYTATALGGARGGGALRAAVRTAHDRSSWDTSDGGAAPASAATEPADSAWPGALLLLAVGTVVLAFVHRRSRAAGGPRR